MASTHASPAPPPLSGITPRPSPVTGGSPGRVGRTYHVLPVAASQLLLCLKRERRKASGSGQHPLCPGPSRGGGWGGHQNYNVPETSSLRGDGLGRGGGTGREATSPRVCPRPRPPLQDSILPERLLTAAAPALGTLIPPALPGAGRQIWD